MEVRHADCRRFHLAPTNQQHRDVLPASKGKKVMCNLWILFWISSSSALLFCVPQNVIVRRTGRWDLKAQENKRRVAEIPSSLPHPNFSPSRAWERQRTLTWRRGQGGTFDLRGLTFLEPVLQSQDLSANGKDVVFVQGLKLLYQESHVPDLRKSKFRAIFCYHATFFINIPGLNLSLRERLPENTPKILLNGFIWKNTFHGLAWKPVGSQANVCDKKKMAKILTAVMMENRFHRSIPKRPLKFISDNFPL